jgi:hypothetical protein
MMLSIKECIPMVTVGEKKEEKMAEYGEWNRKGATLSDVTAKAEYGVDRDFIIKGIESGKIEYRDGSIWGNPYLRILRSQLEGYIMAEIGLEHLTRIKNEFELHMIKKQILKTKKQLKALEARKNELENSMNQQKTTDA